MVTQKSMVIVEWNMRYLTSAWRCVDGWNGLRFQLFAKYLDGLLIFVINFFENQRSMVRSFFLDVIFELWKHKGLMEFFEMRE